MTWREKLMLCSVFVSLCVHSQVKCGPVSAADVSGLNGENSIPFVEVKNLLRKERAVEDCSGLQNDLKEMKMKCKDSLKLAKDNIDGLKTQLDDLFKQLDTTNSPAKDALVILQKIIDLQELDVKINTERDGTKTAKLETLQRAAEKNLMAMKKDFSRNVEIFESAGLKISTEQLKNNKATSTLLTELKKYLEDKIKQPTEQDGKSKQVLQIVTMQIAAMDLMTQISEKYKTQAQIDVIKSKLQHTNDILNDLKEERGKAREDMAKIDKHIAEAEKEILDLNAELSALKQTLLKLNGQIKEADARKKEIMDTIAKLNGKDELISRILTLQFECMETVISAQGQMKAHEYQITDLQKQLEKEQERNTKLQASNDYLRKQLFDQSQDCTDMMKMYTDTEADLTAKITQMSDSTLKNTLQILLLGMEIEQIKKQLKALSPNNGDLKEKLDRQIKEQNKKKEELRKNQRSSDKILQVIDQMEDMWRLQSEEPHDLSQISDLQKILLNLIEKLDDNDSAKPMLKILALQSDVTWIREMLQTVTNQAEMQKTELQRKLKNTEKLLNDKVKELAGVSGDSSQLVKEIAALKKEVSTLEIYIDKAEEMAKQKTEDLKEQLKQHAKELNDAAKELNEKDARIAQQFRKINNLLDEIKVMKQQMQKTEALVNATIAGLKDNLTKKEEQNAQIREENRKLKQDLKKTTECPELKEQYKQKQAEYNDTVLKLSSTILQKVFIIKNLINEVEYLDKKLTEGTADSEELRDALEKKKKELKEAEQKLKADGAVSAKTLNVLQLLTEVWKLQENPTEENLAKIRKLEAKLQGLLTELETSGEKGLDLALKMISIKESMARLKTAQDKMQQQYTTEINGLKKEIDDKDKEIVVLKANCDLSDQLKKRIKQLEMEANESRSKLKKLQEESKKKIASLQEQLETKKQQLANTENKLEKTSDENADLIKRLNNLNDDMKKITEEKNYSLKKAQEEISELNKLLEDHKKKFNKQDLELREKDKTISTLQKERDNVKHKLEKEKNKTNVLETQLETKEKQLANTEDILKKMKDENDALILKQDKLNEDLKKILHEKNNLQQKMQKQISELNKTLKKQDEDLVEKDRRLKEKDEAISVLQKERDNSTAELQQEKNKYNNAVKENEKQRQILTKTKAEVEKLKNIVKEQEKPKLEWPRLDRKTAHRRLVLSENEREARTSLLPQPVPNNPERYDTAIAALGRDGYDSGKHYWEVEVAGRNCYVVGVARESAQRKGLIHYSPKNGYWVILRKRDGRHVALSDKPVLLQMAKTSKIGVLVDFTSKAIIFYDAEQKRSVCRFTDFQFLEPLYPYIETCSDSNINDPPLIFKKAQSPDWFKQ